MRRLLRSRWFWALLIWTAVIAVLGVPLWPAASTPLPPCNYPGAIAPENGLPTCPPDNANYEAIAVSLLVLLWLAVVLMGLIAFALSRFMRWRRRQGVDRDSARDVIP